MQSDPAFLPYPSTNTLSRPQPFPLQCFICLSHPLQCLISLPLTTVLCRLRCSLQCLISLLFTTVIHFPILHYSVSSLYYSLMFHPSTIYYSVVFVTFTCVSSLFYSLVFHLSTITLRLYCLQCSLHCSFSLPFTTVFNLYSPVFN